MVVMTPCMSESFLLTFKCFPLISTRELAESTAAELPGAWHHGAGPRQAVRHRVSPTSPQDLAATNRPQVAGETGQGKCRLHSPIGLSRQALSREAFYITACPTGCWSGCFLKHICTIKIIFKNLRNKGVLPRLQRLPGSDLSQVPLFSHHLQHTKVAPEDHKTHYSLELHVHGHGFWCQNLPLSPLGHSTGWFK